jgi:hypothetical protein
LYKYRNPEGSEPRKYVTKSERYFDVIGAISRIPDHPWTGSSGDLLRHVFEGTPYAPSRSSSENVATQLKMILDSCVKKITEHVDLPRTFTQLARIRHDTQETLQVKDQYLAAIREQKYALCIPELELGYFFETVQDDAGNFMYLESDSDRDSEAGFWLGCQVKVSLFIGLDDDSVPRPYLILKRKQGFHAVSNSQIVSLDWYQDAPRTYGIMFYGAYDRRFMLNEKAVRPSVEDLLTPRNSVFELAAKYIDQESLFSTYEETNDFDIEYAFSDDFRSDADNNVVTQKFLSSNPKFNSMFIEGRDSIRARPVSVDLLDLVGGRIDHVGRTRKALTPGGDSGTLSVPPNSPLLYGDGALGSLIGWFTGGATVTHKLDPNLSDLLSDDLVSSSYAPPYGWYGANLDSENWPAADLLWLRTKVFATKIDTLFNEATLPQEKELERFMKWLGDDDPEL